MFVNYAITKNKGSFLTQIKFSGSDFIGTWASKGYILCREGKIFFWMLKEYENKKKVGRTSKSRYQVYESTNFDTLGGVLEGNWFYDGF